MKNKFTTFLTLIKRKLKRIGRIILTNFRRVKYNIRARVEDFRIGGVSLERTLPSKYAEQFANPTQSTDYRLLDEAFGTCPIKKDDVIVDIGCGEGRILSYLYLRGFKDTKMIGVELDPEVTEIAKKRTEKCNNIDVRCANALDCADIISDASVILMSNPFGEEIVKLFVDMLEKCCKHDVKIYYFYDYNSRHILDRREHWNIMRRGVIKRPEMLTCVYTVYKYTPEERDWFSVDGVRRARQ